MAHEPGRQLLRLTERLYVSGFRLRELTGLLASRDLLALDSVPDLVDDLGICEGGHVAHIGEVGDARDHPSHDLPRPGLGHVRNDPHVLRSRDLADLAFYRADHTILYLPAGRQTALQRDVHLHRPPTNLVDH